MNMRSGTVRILVPGLFAAAALALAMGAGAQTPPPPAATRTPHAAPMTRHHKADAGTAKHDAAMKAECEAMMAKQKEAQEKMQAMDATLDRLVAEMNAAKESKEPGAMEKPMAAVIDELVVQRKAMHSMMMQMQPQMMAHMMGHMRAHRTKGAMECPMIPTMKMGSASEEKKPAM